MKKLGFIIFILLSYIQIRAQSDSCNTEILLKWNDINNNEKKGYLNFNCENCIKLLDTTIIVFNQEYFAKIFLKNCKGEMDYFLYKNNVLRVSGKYSNSIDTFKSIAYDVYPEEGIVVPVTTKYFEPLKYGKWKYYNKRGKLVREENIELYIYKPDGSYSKYKYTE